MQYHKSVPIFVIAVLIASALYPLSALGSSHKDESERAVVESHSDDKKPEEHPQEHESPNQSNSNTTIAQTGPDEGDNRHPSGKDRSIEPGNSQTQGKSQLDPDGKENAYGGNSGKDKPGYDGGLDKGDQDGNNGCGNDDDFEDDNNGNCGGHKHNKVVHPPKNEGGCDANGSTGDKNGRPCDPGKNNASENGCLHGEPDCEKKNEVGGKNDDPKKQDEKKEKNETSSTSTSSVNIAVNINVNNQQSTQHATSQVLAASTLAATGDSLFKLGAAMTAMGISSFLFGLSLLVKKIFNKVFKRGYQSYLYLYEA